MRNWTAKGGVMTANNADVPGVPLRRSVVSLRESVEQQVLAKGVVPIESVDELRCDAWESDEELDAFLADLAASRHPFIS
jgi:hypothetical protein